MKKRLLVLLSVALHQFLPLQAQHSDTLYPVADIYIRTLGGGDGHSSFLKFDISSIPTGNKIDSVNLEVYIYEKSADFETNNDMLFMRMDHQTWMEGNNDTIQLTDTIVQEEGFGADSGWSSSDDLSSLLIHDYSLSNSYFTVVMKASGDMTMMPPYIDYPVDSDDSLMVGISPEIILFYPHESSHDSLITKLIVNYTISPDIISQSGDSAKCEGDSVSFYVSATGDAPFHYEWQKDGVIVPGSVDSLLSISSITLDMAGNYKCVVSNNGGSDTSALMVLTVNALPTVVIQGPDTTCESALLDEGFGIPGDLYLWSTGETTQTITVSESGTYTLAVTDGSGCTGWDTMEVVIYPVPEIDLGHDTILCDDQSIILDAGPGYHSYTWSTDSNSQTITIDTSDFGMGEDTIAVTINYYNCVVSDEIAIEFISCIMDIELSSPSSGYNYSCHLSDSTPVAMQILNSGMVIIPAQDTIYGFCQLDDGPIVSDTLILPEALPNGNTAMLFFDQTLDMSEIKVYDYTIYIHYRKDENAFNDTIRGQVEPIDPPVINLGNDTTLCEDQSILLDAGPGYHGYLWSDNSDAQTNTIDMDDIGIGSGIVYVTTQYYDCISRDTIIVTFLTCAGLIEINSNLDVNFYPNPVKNILTISIHGTVSSTLEIQIVTLTGQVMFNEIISKTTQDYSRQIDLSDYSKGTYFIIVKGDTRVNNGKFIVK